MNPEIVLAAVIVGLIVYLTPFLFIGDPLLRGFLSAADELRRRYP